MSLRENLIKKMREKSLKIKELSLKTGISEPTLKRLRTDDNANPTLDVLMKLSAALSEPIDALVAKVSEKMPIFRQGLDKMPINIPKKFILLVMNRTFDITAGTKAVFEKYSGKQKITKYILGTDFKLYQKLDNNTGHYLTEEQNVIVLEHDQILAIINSEIYEVDYAQI